MEQLEKGLFADSTLDHSVMLELGYIDAIAHYDEVKDAEFPTKKIRNIIQTKDVSYMQENVGVSEFFKLDSRISNRMMSL